MKPATALPWHLDERAICGWLRGNSVPMDVETTVAEVFTGGDRDAAYIVHCANSYPRLVQALKDLALCCDGEEGVRADGSNIQTMAAWGILHELGESS